MTLNCQDPYEHLVITVYVHVCVCVCMFSCVQLFAIPWTVACQALLSMGFSKQEHWSGLPCPSPGDLPDPRIEPVSPASPALAAEFLTTEPPGKPQPRVPEYKVTPCWGLPLKFQGPKQMMSSVTTSNRDIK